MIGRIGIFTFINPECSEQYLSFSGTFLTENNLIIRLFVPKGNLYNESAQQEGLMFMKYMTVLEAAQKWGVSDRRVRFLCSQGRIRGLIQQGRRYLIPEDTQKPVDERVKKSRESKTLSYNDFTRIDFLKSMVSEAPALSAQTLDHWMEDFISHFAYHSNALQGNTLNQTEVDEVLAGLVVYGHPLIEHLSVAGTKYAFDYIQECAAERKPLSQNIIRNIHSQLIWHGHGMRGKYRRVKVRINGMASDPVYLDLIEPQINDLLNMNTQRKKAMHPIERIARFHLDFLEIQPFEEGNGRTARILMCLELMQNGYPPVNIELRDEEEYKAARQLWKTEKDASGMMKLLSDKVEQALEKRLALCRKARHKKSMLASEGQAAVYN